MSSICEAISELHRSGKNFGKIFRILKPCVIRTGVNKVLKHIGETGSPLPKVRSTPKRPARAPQLIKNTQEKIKGDSRRSIRKLAREVSVSYGTMQNVLKKDLKISPYKKYKAKLLSGATKENE